MTHTATQALRQLNVICPYYTMFPLDFPLRQLRAAKPGEWVIDPFCGRGSTNYAARLRGLPSLGIDASPVAVAIARAKLVHTTPSRVIASCRKILAATGRTRVPAGRFWKRAYDQSTLRQVCKLRDSLRQDASSDTRAALVALLLGRLHGPMTKALPRSYLSNQMPRTYAAKPGYALRFWSARDMRPPKVDVLDLVTRKAACYLGDLPTRTSGRVIRGDSRTLRFEHYLDDAASWVITSPPYYGMRTYVPDQWLRNWFLGGPAKVAYDFDGQLSHHSPEEFATDLATTWSNVASACRPGARLIVRFGGIPDRSVNPRDIITRSLALASCGWRIQTIKDAGQAGCGKRQARQFLRRESEPIAECDVFAVLES